jgi:hypothetical protein
VEKLLRNVQTVQMISSEAVLETDLHYYKACHVRQTARAPIPSLPERPSENFGLSTLSILRAGLGGILPYSYLGGRNGDVRQRTTYPSWYSGLMKPERSGAISGCRSYPAWLGEVSESFVGLRVVWVM